MKTYIFDAYAWIEYFIGSKKGKIVEGIFQSEKSNIITHDVTLAEISVFCAKHKYSFEAAEKEIKVHSKIYTVDQEFVKKIGPLYIKTKSKRKHMSMADIFVLLTSLMHRATIVTGDQDFKGLPNVLMLK